MLNKLESKAIGRTLLMAFALLFAGGAMAAVGIPGIEFNPSSSDESLKMLGTLFGGQISQIPGSSLVMSKLMLVFNGAILSLASVTGFYVVVSAVVQTAHDGEVLGKRYSSLWVPIRAVSGISMMVPTSTGFSGVQLLVLWLAAQGVGLANNLYNAGFNEVVRQGGFTSPSISAWAGEEAISKMVPIAACLVANQEAINKKVAADGSDPDPKYKVQKVSNPFGGYSILYGFHYAAEGANDAICGSIGVSGVNMTATSTEAARLVANAAYDAHSEASTEAMKIIVDGISKAAVPGSEKTDFVSKATLKYREIIDKKISESFASSAPVLEGEYKKHVDALKSRGWAGFGGSFMVMSKLANDTANGASASGLSIKSNVVDVYSGSNTGDVLARMTGLIESTKASTTQSVGDAETGALSEIWEQIKGFFSFTEKKLAGGSLVNPILTLQAYGNAILFAFLGILTFLLVAGSASSGASDAVSKIPVLGSIVGGVLGGIKTFISSFMMFFVFMFLSGVGLALTMSVYIPMVPYIIWVSVLMAWMVAVVEAVIATPLWMLMHINPEGDGLANGATEAGYKFMAAVFLRPALSVIAGFAATMILTAVGTFVFTTIDSVQSTSMTGFSSVFVWLAQTVVLVAIFMSLVSKTFGLALTIPEAILRWIGSSLTGGQDIESGAGTHFNTVAGSVSNAGMSSVRKNQYSGGGGSGGGKEVKETPKGGGGEETETSTKPKVSAGENEG